jgi:hypothetical protein
VSQEDRRDVLDLGMVDEPEGARAEPAGPRRPAVSRRAVLALAGAAVVGGGVALTRSCEPTAPKEAGPTPSPTTSRTATVRPAPRPTPVQVVVTQLPGPLLDGRSLDLFGFSSNAIVRVEVAAGRVTRTVLPPLSDVGLSFVPIRGGVLVHRDDGGPTYLIRDGRGLQEADRALAGPGPLLPGPDLDHVWMMGASDAVPNIRLMGIDGHPTGVAVTLPPYRWSDPIPDGGGYPLVFGIGGTYWARPDGLTRVTTGAVCAGGPVGWLVADCDEHARCSGALVTRSGSRRTVQGLIDPELAVGNPPFPEGVLSPDGRTAALFVGDPALNMRLVLFDLASGKRRPTDLIMVGGSVSQSLAWTADGRWLFAVDSSARIISIDPASGRSRLLVPDSIVPALPVFEKIALR